MLPAAETPPAAHAGQVLAPAVAENVPAAQSVHAKLPLLVLYWPAAHAEHGPPSAPVYPALQAQAAAAELALGELELVAQGVHRALPVVDLYDPMVHAVHGPEVSPFIHVYPTLHVHAATAELGLGESELVGHRIQVPAAVAPNVVEYVPAAQLVHANEDVAPV